MTTVQRIDAMLTLDNVEERGELFEFVGDTILTRTRVAVGSES